MATFDDTSVEKNQSTSPMIVQRQADRIAFCFVSIAVVIAVVSGIIFLSIESGGLVPAVVIFISVMIIAYPLAFRLAIPLAVKTGTERADGLGIKIRDAQTIERAGKISHIVFVGARTLVAGRAVVCEIVPNSLSGYTPELLLRIAASVELGSDHYLAKSILAEAKKKKLKLSKATNFQALAGRGVQAYLGNHQIILGNPRLMEEKYVKLEPLSFKARAQKLQQEGKTVAFLAVDGELVGLIAVARKSKEGAKKAVKELHQLGIGVAMVTGDNRYTSRAVAESLGIERVVAEVLPQSKAEEIKKIQRKYRVVAAVSDSVSHTPASAVADINIVMGLGANRIGDAVGVALDSSDFGTIVAVVRLSKETMQIIRGSLFWAFFYNLVGIPFAAGALYPIFGILFSPVIAVAVVAFSSLSVFLYSRRLKWVKI